MKEMVLNHDSARWLANTVEECSLSEGRKDYFKTFSIGSMTLVANRCSNALDTTCKSLITVAVGVEAC